MIMFDQFYLEPLGQETVISRRIGFLCLMSVYRAERVSALSRLDL